MVRKGGAQKAADIVHYFLTLDVVLFSILHIGLALSKHSENMQTGEKQATILYHKPSDPGKRVVWEKLGLI